MIRRLRAKFICINMAIVTVMMLAILGMLLHFTRDDLEQQSIRVMQSVMEDRAYPSRPGKFPRQAQLPYFYVSVNTLGELSASFGGYYDLTDTEAIQQIITLALNSGEDTGILKDYSKTIKKKDLCRLAVLWYQAMGNKLPKQKTTSPFKDTRVRLLRWNTTMTEIRHLGLSIKTTKPNLPSV